MTPILERLSLRSAIVPGLLVAALALAGCGGGDDDASSANASASTASTQKNGTTTQQDGTSARRNGGADASELQACLEKQGVERPERPAYRYGERPEGGAPPPGRLPGGGGGPPADGERRQGGRFGDLSDEEREKLEKAMEECGGGRASGANGERRQRPDVSSGEYQKSINAYVTCVRKNGYDLPDPDFSGNGPIFDPEKVDQQDATFKKASAACQSELRTRRSANGSGSITSDEH